MFLRLGGIRAYTSSSSPPSSTLRYPFFRTYAKLSGGGSSESYRYDAVVRRHDTESSYFAHSSPADGHEVCVVVTKSCYQAWISSRTPITAAWMKDLDISSTKFPSSKVVKLPVNNIDELDESNSSSSSTMRHFLFVDDSANHSSSFDKVWSGLGTYQRLQ